MEDYKSTLFVNEKIIDKPYVENRSKEFPNIRTIIVLTFFHYTGVVQ